MATYVPPQKNAALVFYTALTDASDTTLLKANPTLADGDAKVSIDGGAFANLATLPDVYPAGGYAVRVQLSAAENSGDNVVVYLHDAVGTEWCDQLINIQTVASQIDDLATQASVDTVDGNVDSILDDTGTDIPASIAALNDLSAADVWAYGTRTLTQTAAEVAAAVAGSTLTIHRGDTFTATLTGLGSLADYVSLDFTVKSKRSDDDDSAVVRIRLNATGLGDGLLRINAAEAGTPGNGSITIDDLAAGDVTLTLAADETEGLTPHVGYFYDIQMITATAVETLTAGTCNVTADVTRLIA